VAGGDDEAVDGAAADDRQVVRSAGAQAGDHPGDLHLGNVGQHALRQIIEHRDLELVGVHASSPSKVGRDAAELCGVDVPTGVRATDDLDALVELGADCVVYTSQGETRPKEALAEITAFLRAGTNVVATSLVWLINPDAADSWLRDPLEAACRAGGATMYVNGIDPGFSGDMLPFAALSLSQSATSVLVQGKG